RTDVAALGRQLFRALCRQAPPLDGASVGAAPMGAAYAHKQLLYGRRPLAGWPWVLPLRSPLHGPWL
ncbi:hypothetical protein B296_00048006, partial [Ensete ventricosum]